MGKVDKNTLKRWFKRGAKPNEDQFESLIDSMIHKDEGIALEQMPELIEALDEKAPAEHGHGNYLDKTNPNLEEGEAEALKKALNIQEGAEVIDEIVPEEVNKAVNSQAVMNWSIQKINTMADLRKTVGKFEGQVVELIQYYENVPCPAVKYKWTTNQGVDDGASCVVITGEGSWMAQFGEVVFVESFGVLENEDCSAKINKMISLGYKKIDIFNHKTLLIDSSILISDNLELLNTSKSIYKLKDNRTALTSVFSATQKRGFKISAIIDGNRDNQTATGSQDGGLHGVSITGCEDFDVENVLAYNCHGDGVYIRGYGSTEATFIPTINARLNRVASINCRRQGLSVISVKGITVLNSIFTSTNGTAPQAGIDFEPNHTWELIEDVYIDNCYINNNLGRGILFHVKSKCYDVSITNTTIKDNGDGAIVFTGGGEFNSINIYQNKHIDGVVLTSPGSVKNLNIYGNIFIGRVELRVTDGCKIYNNKINSLFTVGSIKNLDFFSNILSDVSSTATEQSASLITLNIGTVNTLPENVNIYDNLFKNNSILQLIYVSSKIQNVKIVGNTFENNSSTSSTAGSLIYFHNSTAIAKVYGNKFKNNNTAVYNLSSTASNISIYDNEYEGNLQLTRGTIANNLNLILLGDNSKKIKSASGTLPDLTAYNYEVGDVIHNRNPSNGILKWMCITGGTASVWKPIYIDKSANVVSDVISADATDLATTLVLVNELKAKNNELISKLKTAGLMNLQ